MNVLDLNVGNEKIGKCHSSIKFSFYHFYVEHKVCNIVLCNILLYPFFKEKSICLCYVCFSKTNDTINNKREQQRKGDNDGNIKKSVKRRRTSFSAKRAENDHEPVEESHKNVSGRDHDCDQYKSNEDNYRVERRKSTLSQEDESRMEKRETEANINNDRIDRDRIESKNSDEEDNDKKSEKGSVEHDTNDRTTREMEH